MPQGLWPCSRGGRAQLRGGASGQTHRRLWTVCSDAKQSGKKDGLVALFRGKSPVTSARAARPPVTGERGSVAPAGVGLPVGADRRPGGEKTGRVLTERKAAGLAPAPAGSENPQGDSGGVTRLRLRGHPHTHGAGGWRPAPIGQSPIHAAGESGAGSRAGTRPASTQRSKPAHQFWRKGQSLPRPHPPRAPSTPGEGRVFTELE